MDDAAKDLFINSFIPKLNSIVPSIIIITPLASEVYPHARRVKIVKEKGVSRVEIENPTIVKED